MGTDTLANLERRIREIMSMIRRRRQEGRETDALERYWKDMMIQYAILMKGEG